MGDGVTAENTGRRGHAACKGSSWQCKSLERLVLATSLTNVSKGDSWKKPDMCEQKPECVDQERKSGMMDANLASLLIADC